MFQTEVKWLRMILDDKFQINQHMNMLITKCEKVINLLRCITGSKWGWNCIQCIQYIISVHIRLWKCYLRKHQHKNTNTSTKTSENVATTFTLLGALLVLK